VLVAAQGVRRQLDDLSSRLSTVEAKAGSVPKELEQSLSKQQALLLDVQASHHPTVPCLTPHHPVESDGAYGLPPVPKCSRSIAGRRVLILYEIGRAA
jgi:hypothetical protein